MKTRQFVLPVRALNGYKLCPECDQPMLKKGQKRKHPDDYRHASGCPLDNETPVRVNKGNAKHVRRGRAARSQDGSSANL